MLSAIGRGVNCSLGHIIGKLSDSHLSPISMQSSVHLPVIMLVSRDCDKGHHASAMSMGKMTKQSPEPLTDDSLSFR